ncbi:MAG: Lpg1974 family pore-forming outer membrane protein [Parachlamydiales bacterium]|jgi:hypothetical protein
MKTKLFILTTLLAALAISTSFSAGAVKERSLKKDNNKKECYEQGYGVEAYQMSSGYNAPARIQVSRDWGFFMGGNFLYLHPYQENMQIAEISRLTQVDGVYTILGVVEQKFDWAPGFKFNFGWAMNRDKWNLYTEYFHFHKSSLAKASVDLSNHDYLLLSSLYGSSLENGYYEGTPDNGSYLKSKWKLTLDFVDLNLNRTFYNGERLILTPEIGLRAAWIHQKVNGYWLYSTYSMHLPTSAKAGSFGIGPKFGLKGKWLLGRGFSMLSDVTGSVLHTHYRLKKDTHSYDSDYPFEPVDIYHVHNEINYLRPALETELGLGWGMYCSNKDWHVDVALTYIFNVYWHQNMISNYYNGLTNTSAGDLYLHGANFKLMFNF